MDSTFPHRYECERLREIRESRLKRYYFPGACTEGGKDGILARIRPEFEEAWIGVFAFGGLVPGAFSGIFATPDPEVLCVVAAGEGYIVSTTKPTRWESVCAKPIIDVRPICSHAMIVFASFTELVAYGAAGFMWRTARLAWDGLQMTEVSGGFIKGEFWDIPSEDMKAFEVDLSDGTHRGGVESD